MYTEIKYLFPNAIPLVDFELRNDSDGKGTYISKWDEVKLGPRPTSVQIAAVKDLAKLSAQNSAAQTNAMAYLLSTDWYVLRKVETGIEVPLAITTLRNAARAKL